MLVRVTAGLILAAGMGTRLRPLTEHVAKPLLPIGDRTVLAHVVAAMRACEVDPIAANAFFLADEVAQHAGALGLLVSREDELLGTAGGVRRAWPLLSREGVRPNLLVATGDVLTRTSFAQLLTHPTVDATLLVEPRACGEGNVGLDRDGFVVRLRNEPLRPGEVSGGFSLGVQCLAPSMWEHLPSKGCLVTDLYMPLIRNGARVLACETAAHWIDVGTLASYLAANLDWLDTRLSWVGVHAAISGTTLDQVVVGEGARLAPGAYRRCVVLPGARVKEPGENRVYWDDTFVDVVHA